MNKIRLTILSIVLLTVGASANPEYKDPTTGVEIIFAKDGSNWDKIIANGEADVAFGDRQDIRQATSKATMRAKANISKFLTERVKSKETLEGMSKTITDKKQSGGQVTINSAGNTVEAITENISNSADAILKGVIVLEQNINKKEKYVSVRVGMSRKTMTTADNMSNAIEKDLSESTVEKDTENATIQMNDGQNEIRRSKNYNDF